MLINLTLAKAASLIISTHAIRQPPTAPPQNVNGLLERGA